MQIIKHPKKSEWSRLLKRPAMDSTSLEASVANILHEVKASGDEALKRFATIFDKVSVTELQVTKEEIAAAEASLSKELKEAIPHYEQFKAFQTGNVFSVTVKRGAKGGIVYYEQAANRPDLVLKDLIKITNPELLPDYQLYFFQKLN